LTAYWSANWPIWVSAFCVLAVYSYLFKDNALYRVMMQIFIGVNLGYQAIVQWRDVLYPQWWLPMIDGFKALFGGPGSPWGALWSLVGVIGALFYLQLSRKYASLSKIAIGITIGIGAGLTFKSQFGQNIPQILDSFKPLAPSIVRPQPRTVVRMPGSLYPPAVDGSLAIFVDGNKVVADEVLGGVEVWKSAIPQTSTGPATVNGDEVRIPCSGVTVTLGRSTGRLISPTPTSSIASGQPATEARFLQLRDHIAAFSGSQQTWASAESGRLIGASGGRVFASSDSRLLILDAIDGKTLASLTLPKQPTALPAMATFRQPQFSNGVVLVPVENEVLAYAIRDGVSEGVHTGDLLWSAKYSEPIIGVESFDGVSLVTGEHGSEIWETPNPQAKLTAKDYFDNWVSVITIVCVMTYFFFSFKRRGPVTVAASNVGRWVLMIGFGAFFGNTVMTRMSFLLDRLMFLIDDWLRPFFHALIR